MASSDDRTFPHPFDAQHQNELEALVDLDLILPHDARGLPALARGDAARPHRHLRRREDRPQ